MSEMKKISIIKVPLWYGRGRRGVEEAPALLTAALQESELQSCIDKTIDIYIPTLSEDDSNNMNAKHLQSIVAINRNLAQVVERELAAHQLVLTIGGDHSIGLGSVSGSLMHDENMGVIWYDAHGDMNTESTSPTGNVHGMPVAALMGLCKTELNAVPKKHIKPRNIFWIGARDLDKGEQALAEQLQLHIYSTNDIHHRGMEAVLQEIRETMEKQQIKHLHLSFDVDAFDPQLFPATGVKVPDGLWMEDFDTFVRLLPSMPELTAIDLVEYNPKMDNDQKECLNKTLYFIEQLLRVCLG